MASQIPPQKFIAPTAIIDPTAVIGEGTRIWAFAQVMEHAVIGRDCVIGNGAYIDRHVTIGDRVRVHNKALLYHGITIEDDVFIGPGVCWTNDPWPRSGSTRDMTNARWRIHKGAVIGANTTILPDLSIGAYAVIGAGSLVSKPVPSHALVYGHPARIHGAVCRCGFVIRKNLDGAAVHKLHCEQCKADIPVIMPAEAL
ncbi:MAG TPA: acyltransferase [Verrucomicrobiae bacterium]|jgi:UDP-3-O-[3-hydroxymyristoyl] glucosamine N-acyltransferase|nr:acyltransferase [Verrucomicrobiae bacterium]